MTTREMNCTICGQAVPYDSARVVQLVEIELGHGPEGAVIFAHTLCKGCREEVEEGFRQMIRRVYDAKAREQAYKTKEVKP